MTVVRLTQKKASFARIGSGVDWVRPGGRTRLRRAAVHLGALAIHMMLSLRTATKGSGHGSWRGPLTTFAVPRRIGMPDYPKFQRPLAPSRPPARCNAVRRTDGLPPLGERACSCHL